jgi:tRNA G18 (ribose-2'-O)-methylase SpoU
MGAAFVLPIVRSRDLLADLTTLRERWGVELAATVLDPAAEALDDAARGPRLGLLLGGEAQGLGPPWLAACSRRLTISMQWGVDSLNVAVAAGVFLYHFTRRAEQGPKQPPA